jgi:hypothetical protein
VPGQPDAVQLLFHRADGVRDDAQKVALRAQSFQKRRRFGQDQRPERDVAETLGDALHHRQTLRLWNPKPFDERLEVLAPIIVVDGPRHDALANLRP